MFKFLTATLTLSATVAFAAETPDYERDIQPILTAHCAGCHNADEAYSGFRVDTFGELTKPIVADDALQQGPTLTPGVAETSRIYRLMAGLDAPRMPPEDDADAVPADQLAAVKAWIEGGAPGPSGNATIPALVVPSIPAAAGHNDTVFAVARQLRSQTESDPLNEVTLVGLATGLYQTDGVNRAGIIPTPGPINEIAALDDGSVYVATGVTGLRGEVLVFRDLVLVDNGNQPFFEKPSARWQGHRDAIQAIDVSDDGSKLVTASYDRDIIVWDTATGEQLVTLRGHNGAIFDVAFSPDASLVASASADETVKVWDTATGERLDTMPQPEGEVNAVFFSGDGRFVYAGSADNRIRKWTVKSRGRKAINPLAIARFAHDGPVTHLVSSRDGKQIISASADRTIKIWRASDLTLLATHGPFNDIVSTLSVDLSSSSSDTSADPAVHVFLMSGANQTFSLPTSNKAATKIAEAVPVVFPQVASEDRLANEQSPNDDALDAQHVELPARVSGAIESEGDADFYAFDAKRGEQWIVEVEAARGSVKKEDRSPLDSLVEVLDSDGKPIERVVLQAVRDSYFTFRGKNSTQVNDFRVFNWQEMELGDLFYANGEVTEFFMYPAGPDSGFTVYPGTGNRHLRFDTTGISHALGDPAYVVEAYPPGSDIAPNGLPIFPIYFENDDDASRQHGKDSVVSFTAPADDRYTVRVTDARGSGGKKFNYTLRVRPRRPAFAARVSMKLDKVSPGSSKSAAVAITRQDGFEGAVNVSVENLPEGFAAPPELSIEPHQQQVSFPITVGEAAKTPTAEMLKQVQVVATAKAEDDRDLRVVVRSLGKLEVAEEPAPFAIEVVASVVDGLPTIDLHPGETTSLVVKADRRDFKGRIQFGKQDAGRNLPFGVFVDNIGLNGLMIPEGKSEQEFFVTAAPVAEPQERTWFLRSSEGGGVTSNLLRVRILPAEQNVASN